MAFSKFSVLVFALCLYTVSAAVAPTAEPEASPEVPTPQDPTPQDPSKPQVPEPTVEPEGTPTPDDGFICFPGAATVELQSGARKQMADLSVGDRVKVGPSEFSEVFMFTHKMADVVNNFVTLSTESGAKLSLTSGHYLYVSGNLVAARTVKVGDTVELADGSHSRVNKVNTERLTGLYNPQTVHGDVIVDGVRASTYTTTVAPQFAHAALSPLRAAYESLGLSSKLFDNGARLLAKFTPKGESVIA